MGFLIGFISCMIIITIIFLIYENRGKWEIIEFETYLYKDKYINDYAEIIEEEVSRRYLIKFNSKKGKYKLDTEGYGYGNTHIEDRMLKRCIELQQEYNSK